MAKRLLTVLCYSAGVQSHAILKMVECGMIEKPQRFSLVCADPGMESSVSMDFRDRDARQICAAAGIGFVVAGGPDLYRDIQDAANGNKDRLDTPPFWTQNDDGTVGQLTQQCTREYKIRPMNRAVRRELLRIWGIPTGPKGNRAIAVGAVEQWIGFTADEQHRFDDLLKQPHAKFTTFRCPLIELGLTKSDVVGMYKQRGWKMPIMSICNGCPFTGLRALKDKHDNRPDDWAQAVTIDESCRDLTSIGVKNPCYVSRTMIPLRELAEMNFELVDPIENDLAQCLSGVCFS